jgi:RimJ/RimL family protein N-acetyltransferase
MSGGRVLAQGERVRLRAFTAADITPRYLGWLNDAATMRYSRHRGRAHDDASCRAYLASFAASDSLFVAIERLADGVVVGTMTACVDRARRSADLGILLGDATARGQGLASDAWLTLARHLRRRGDIDRVTGGTLAANLAMRRVMEKTGMRLCETRQLAGEQLEDQQPALIFAFPPEFPDGAA